MPEDDTPQTRPANDLEARAERLGLPTDPEAWQDGGMGVAATGRHIVEADMLAEAETLYGPP
jgi:hypothetical protein